MRWQAQHRFGLFGAPRLSGFVIQEMQPPKDMTPNQSAVVAALAGASEQCAVGSEQWAVGSEVGKIAERHGC